MRRKRLFWHLLPILAGFGVLVLVMAAAAEMAMPWHTVLVGLGLAGLSAGTAWLVARRVAGPLAEMEAGAERFAAGRLEERLVLPESRELADLAQALNRMAARWEESRGRLTRQQRDLEMAWANMVEAVLAVDAAERILSLNPSAARLFGVDAEAARGRFLVEVVRNADLNRFVSRTLEAAGPVAGEIVLHREDQDLFLQAQGNILRESSGEPSGAIVVLHDVTTLRKLETIRRDFVANVSHELKSPLTSIKGFVETLLDGGLENREDALRFLTIVSRQVERLMALVEDLLALSRIEREEEQGEIARERQPLRPVLEAAVQLCEARATEKELRIELACDEELQANISGPLVEQAVVNLLDNAIKYSPAGETVWVSASTGPEGPALQVRDRGAGMEKKHLSRLFERFYRVDPARSRNEGGTGLGLAIVKHVAQVHGGRVSVESAPGRGSTFTIQLPG